MTDSISMYAGATRKDQSYTKAGPYPGDRMGPAGLAVPPGKGGLKT
jgi:hypothetical protein